MRPASEVTIFAEKSAAADPRFVVWESDQLSPRSKVRRLASWLAARGMRCLSLIEVCWLIGTWTELELEGSNSRVGMTKAGHSGMAKAAAASNARYLVLCACRDGI